MSMFSKKRRSSTIWEERGLSSMEVSEFGDLVIMHDTHKAEGYIYLKVGIPPLGVHMGEVVWLVEPEES